MARVTDGMEVMELSLGLPVSEAKLEILSHAVPTLEFRYWLCMS